MRLPVDVKRVGPTGNYGDYRAKARRTHWGLDLQGPRGTPVYAPERMVVRVTMSGGKYTHAGYRGVKLTGYEPAAVLADGESGVVHVLGHLEPQNFAATYEEGEQVGTIGRPGHVHWEVRKLERKPWPRATRKDDTLDPLAWLSAFRTPSSSPSAASPFDVLTAAQDMTDRLRAGLKEAVVATATADALVWVGLAIVLAHAGSNRRRR